MSEMLFLPRVIRLFVYIAGYAVGMCMTYVSPKEVGVPRPRRLRGTADKASTSLCGSGAPSEMGPLRDPTIKKEQGPSWHKNFLHIKEIHTHVQILPW